MSTSPNYTVHVYRRPLGTEVGGYVNEADYTAHTVPVAPTAEWSGPVEASPIANFVRSCANDYFGAYNWTVEGTDILEKGDDSSRRAVLRVIPPHSTEPINLMPYLSYIEGEGEMEDDDTEDDDTEDEVEASEDSDNLDVLTPIRRIIETAADGLVANIVDSPPTTEAGLRERFRRFGLLS